eukprot:Phypoly_transcript_05032.p1 GENE.Phypoly_transcript_05032~~Phypoly_transcript_05032.p1  ORF type:complete len:314 (-),score=60.25 Phypoly_transcript_05032:122-1063(-)
MKNAKAFLHHYFTKQKKDVVTPHPAWVTILHDYYSCLSLKELKRLCCVSFGVFTLAKQILEQNFIFRIPKGRQINYFVPQCVRVTSASSIPTKSVLKKLGFAPEKNQQLKNIHKFTSLTHLVFGYRFNHPVDNLPFSITHLTLGDDFVQPVDHLPPSLLSLTFGARFDRPVPLLPSSLTSLTFGNGFNQIVSYPPPSSPPVPTSPDSFLPPSLTSLTFGKFYNQPIESLPPFLTFLTFGDKFDAQIQEFPPNLTELKFGMNFDQPLPALPTSLLKLQLDSEYGYSMKGAPPTLQIDYVTTYVSKDLGWLTGNE